MSKRIMALLLAAVLCMGILAGCGAKQPETTKSGEKNLGKLTVAEFRGLNWTPMYVAYANGFFKDEGLELEMIKIDDGPNCFKGMHAGQNDLCILSQEVALKAEEAGQHSTALVTMLSTRYYSFAATKEIQSVADLKGKTVYASTPGSAPYTFCVAIMEEAGLEIGRDVTLVQLNKGAVVAALQRNEVQAAFINADNFQEADHVDGIHYLVDTRKTEDAEKYLKSDEFPAEVIYAEKKFAENNKEKIQAFVNACVRGLDWVQKHSSEEIAAAIDDLFPSMDKDSIKDKVEIMRGAFSKNGFISEKGEMAVLDFAKRSGIISTDMKYEDLVDMSFVQKALDAGLADK